MINQKLAQLYEEYFVNNQIMVDGDMAEFSTPFLLKVSESYEDAKQKVMIVGQETFTWYGKYGEFLSQKDPIGYAQSQYSQFVESESHNYNSPFWNYLNKLFENTNVEWIWNNAFKMETVEYLSNEKFLGKKVSLSVLSKSKHYKYFIDKIKSLQRDIFIKELEILKPDIVIFFTGNPYDSLFMDWQFDTNDDFYQSIPKAVEMGIDKWKLGRLNSPLLPYQTFRTYHPNYLKRVSKKIMTLEQKESIFSILRNEISKRSF